MGHLSSRASVALSEAVDRVCVAAQRVLLPGVLPSHWAWSHRALQNRACLSVCSPENPAATCYERDQSLSFPACGKAKVAGLGAAHANSHVSAAVLRWAGPQPSAQTAAERHGALTKCK